ncbi:hypothetical protein I8U24_10525 [Thermoactinomyces sp. CICC 24226]|uniref:hypothetical protein n=1 Tax=Thermoactinomyces sp. CICC 24226 TaxID=2767431 RepID=UPI0018DD867E|nr:hypothetical protein [Thermoactinomyces sp. CICC 24226]MBI0392543.1 hypothetical protein [Thermoactinomyces sp. CICC 24226]
MKHPVKAFNDQGTLKFRIYRKGISRELLTIEELVKWMEENEKKPATGKVAGFINRQK